MTKGDICKELEGAGVLKPGHYDTALPQDWLNANSNEDNYHQVLSSHVWDYSNDRIFGKPLNILEAYLFLQNKEH